MARNHGQVIDKYRSISIELEALGLRQYVMDSYFHYHISQQTGYSMRTVRSIIDRYEETKEYNYFQKFLGTIPNVYGRVRKHLITTMVNSNITNEG